MQDRRPEFQDASEMMSAADGPALGASRVGAELQAARQRLGWGLPDVATTLRIRLPYLEAIEEGRLADLPGNAYAVGFLRSYSTFLGLDAAEVARRFRAEAQEVNRKPVLTFPAPVPQRGVPAGAVVLLGVLIAAGTYGAYLKFSGETAGPRPVVAAVPERMSREADRIAPPAPPAPPAPTMSPQVASVLPAPAAPPTAGSPAPVAAVPPPPLSVVMPPPVVVAAVPAPSPPPPVEPSRVLLRSKAGGYVQVSVRQGAVLLHRVLKAGESWPVPKGPVVVVTTANAGGLEVVLDGKASPLGPTGAFRRDVAIDPDPAKGAPAIVPARTLATRPAAAPASPAPDVPPQ